MYIEPKDSRQRYTKQCIFDSFLTLIEGRPVSDVSVSEISEKAGVSRKTFYKYYSDQFALLKAMQEDLAVGFEEQIKNLPPNIFDIMPALIVFAGQHKVLIRAVFENRGKGNFIDQTIAHLYQLYHEEWEAANPQSSKKDVEFLFYFVASGLAGIIQLWLFENPEMSEEEVTQKAETFLRLSSPVS